MTTFFNSHTDEELISLMQSGIIDEIAMKTKWLGFSPAQVDQIQAKENILGISLPPSYREFLLNSNGFRKVSIFLDNLLPIEKLEWAKNTEEDWWFDLLEVLHTEMSDIEYLIYGQEQNQLRFRSEYFKQSLKISEWYDGMCVFLNPNVKDAEEWEVLVYANWYPGTKRFPSFKKYLLDTHETNLALRDR